MDFVNDTLPILSGSLAGLALASLVVFAVLLIGFILYRRAQNAPKQPITPPQAAQSAAPASEPLTAVTTQPAEEEKPQENVVVELVREEEPPIERAERFQKLASTAIEEGRLGDAKSLFNQALSVATDNNIDPIAAHARYELGNLAKAGGDLLTACEHWQMARSLYQEVGDKRKVRELDSIMADSGCPSDWVLNNF